MLVQVQIEVPEPPAGFKYCTDSYTVRTSGPYGGDHGEPWVRVFGSEIKLVPVKEPLVSIEDIETT